MGRDLEAGRRGLGAYPPQGTPCARHLPGHRVAVRPCRLHAAAPRAPAEFGFGRTAAIVHESAPVLTGVIQAAAELQAVCQAQGWQYCFIGGLAVLRWGEPRETVDADLTLLSGFGGEEPFIQILLQHFEPRIPDAAEFARQRRVLLLKSGRGVGLDVSLGALPFEELVVQRSSLFDYPRNIKLRTCSAEDLIVLKAFAGRGQDWVDVEGVI